MMRYIKIAFMIIIAYVLQVCVISAVRPFGVVPNLTLVLLICLSIGENEWFYAGITGVICGILLDASSGTPMGLNALVCMYTGIICSVFSKKFFRGKFLVSILFVFAVSVAYESLIYVFGFALWNNSNIWYCVTRVILPASLCNMALSSVIYFPLKKFNHIIN